MEFGSNILPEKHNRYILMNDILEGKSEFYVSKGVSHGKTVDVFFSHNERQYFGYSELRKELDELGIISLGLDVQDTVARGYAVECPRPTDLDYVYSKITGKDMENGDKYFYRVADFMNEALMQGGSKYRFAVHDFFGKFVDENGAEVESEKEIAKLNRDLAKIQLPNFLQMFAYDGTRVSCQEGRLFSAKDAYDYVTAKMSGQKAQEPENIFNLMEKLNERAGTSVLSFKPRDYGDVVLFVSDDDNYYVDAGVNLFLKHHVLPRELVADLKLDEIAENPTKENIKFAVSQIEAGAFDKYAERADALRVERKLASNFAGARFSEPFGEIDTYFFHVYDGGVHERVAKKVFAKCGGKFSRDDYGNTYNPSCFTLTVPVGKMSEFAEKLENKSLLRANVRNYLWYQTVDRLVDIIVARNENER